MITVQNNSQSPFKTVNFSKLTQQPYTHRGHSLSILKLTSYFHRGHSGYF